KNDQRWDHDLDSRDMDTSMNDNDAIDDHNQSTSSGMTESSNGSLTNGELQNFKGVFVETSGSS
ncbi:hypothetical protein Tco_1349102, partial [Tanacetum coccineum]